MIWGEGWRKAIASFKSINGQLERLHTLQALLFLYVPITSYVLCQIYNAIPLYLSWATTFLPSCLPSFLPGLSFSRQNPKKKQNTEKKQKNKPPLNIYIASVKPWDKPPTTNGYKVTKWCLQGVVPSLSQFTLCWNAANHQTNSHPGRKCPFPWHPLHLLQKKHFSSQGWRGTWWNRTSGVVIERIAI